MGHGEAKSASHKMDDALARTALDVHLDCRGALKPSHQVEAVPLELQAGPDLAREVIVPRKCGQKEHDYGGEEDTRWGIDCLVS